MNSKTLAVAASAVVALSAGAAFAQQPAAAPAAAAPAVSHGPAVPGLCILSVQGAIGGSTVGKYVDTRMQQIVQQVNAELNGERTAIENEGKTLEGQRATLDRTTLEQRASALQVRANALQRKAQQREREVSATEQKAVGRVGQEMEPLIRQVYQQRQCSVLLNRDAVVIASPAADITPGVVTALNAKITQFAFDRERLDAQPQAAAAATPAPATRR
ncbi:OmpH family outer membrane protein [Phenylobacterium sp. J367]|uniref:OmpH family outer membrane protein n=1 Tax=Phenylobacterium sp. J367 TaxID=2898435 RepID=UPI002151B555|nr:OmpH family outer membrane protein [Phenylobacterium sp. J367]MCR5880463.1 OmpH family outer membrane protein [Phenylobacterium sp. J367]